MLGKVTQNSYNAIAGYFASTRGYEWPDFKYFKPYIKDGMKILDLGCGHGRLSEIFNQYNIEYTGIDYSQKLIEIACEKYPDEKFLCQSMVRDLPEGEYDMIFMIASFNHIERSQQDQVLKNVYNALKPGGYVCMTNWNMWDMSLKRKSLWSFWRDRIVLNCWEFKKKYKISKWRVGFFEVLTLWKTTGVQEVLYYYAFTRRGLNSMLRWQGFRVLESFYTRAWHKNGNIIHIAQKKDV